MQAVSIHQAALHLALQLATLLALSSFTLGLKPGHMRCPATCHRMHVWGQPLCVPHAPALSVTAVLAVLRVALGQPLLNHQAWLASWQRWHSGSFRPEPFDASGQSRRRISEESDASSTSLTSFKTPSAGSDSHYSSSEPSSPTAALAAAAPPLSGPMVAETQGGTQPAHRNITASQSATATTAAAPTSPHAAPDAEQAAAPHAALTLTMIDLGTMLESVQQAVQQGTGSSSSSSPSVPRALTPLYGAVQHGVHRCHAVMSALVRAMDSACAGLLMCGMSLSCDTTHVTQL